MRGQPPIKGTRVGHDGESPEWKEVADKDLAPRAEAAYRCPDGHGFSLNFAIGAEVPGAWDCRHCGKPALRDGAPPGARPDTPAYRSGDKFGHLKDARSPLDRVRERRTDAELDAILDESLAAVRAQRGMA